MGEGAIDDSSVASLAEGLRAHDLDVGWGVATVLRSRAFFAQKNLGTRVLGPVEFVVGPVHSLELLDPPPSTLVLADWAARIGEDLFYPPNVGGWPGGRSWLSAQSLIGRANYAAALVSARGIGRERPLDPLALAWKYGRGSDRRDALTFFAELLLGVSPDANWLKQLDTSLGPSATWNEETARCAVVQILSSPEDQLA
jgi:hypothetical protein